MKKTIKIAKYGAGLRSTVKARDFVRLTKKWCLLSYTISNKKIINRHGFKAEHYS